jgi:hypothetical protein
LRLPSLRHYFTDTYFNPRRTIGRIFPNQTHFPPSQRLPMLPKLPILCTMRRRQFAAYALIGPVAYGTGKTWRKQKSLSGLPRIASRPARVIE